MGHGHGALAHWLLPMLLALAASAAKTTHATAPPDGYSWYGDYAAEPTPAPSPVTRSQTKSPAPAYGGPPSADDGKSAASDYIGDFPLEPLGLYAGEDYTTRPISFPDYSSPSPEPSPPTPSPESSSPAPSPEPSQPAPSPESSQPAPSPEPSQLAPPSLEVSERQPSVSSKTALDKSAAGSQDVPAVPAGQPAAAPAARGKPQAQEAAPPPGASGSGSGGGGAGVPSFVYALAGVGAGLVAVAGVAAYVVRRKRASARVHCMPAVAPAPQAAQPPGPAWV